MRDAVRQASRQRRAGDVEGALETLAAWARAGEWGPEEAERGGRLLARCLEDAGRDTVHVRFLGQCTTTWLLPALTVVAWAEGAAVRATEAEYDNVLQDLMTGAAADDPDDPDVWVLVPWIQRLLASEGRPLDERVAMELETWTHAWRLVAGRSTGRVVQVGYDAPGPGASGTLLGSRRGLVAAVREVDRALRSALPAGAAWLDLSAVAGDLGRRRFYSARRYHWTKQPFSEDGVVELARHVWAAVRALRTGPRKVLVLDLDHTLWGGVVGDDGPHGIELGESADGEAFVAFQRYCRQLSERGIVLAVASKNNLADALEPFEVNPSMVLKRSDFAAFEASWDPKPDALRRMAAELRLSLDHFVFFDDNPAERELMRLALPAVAVVDVPPDPADYVGALERSLLFEAVAVTDDDRERVARYQAESARTVIREQAADLGQYLASLEMVGDVRAIDDADMPRVVQLIGKTNQFNLTTRRHSAADVRQLTDRGLGLTLRLADRFGDYGLVGVALAVVEDDGLRIDTLLMSCRVIGRTAEQFFVGRLVAEAEARGLARVIGEYVPTRKNGLVAETYPSLGFEEVPAPAELRRFVLEIPGPRPSTAVRPA